MSTTRQRRRGFTLIELLVTLAVIAVLLALLLPAVQSAREAARRTQCRSRLRQIGVAVHDHVSLQGHFPSNGWGFRWVGEPGRGAGRDQPGGWIYNLLPHLEQNSVRKLGRGEPAAVKLVSLGELSQTHLTVFDCPSRPGSPLEPNNPLVVPHNAEWRPEVAKTDYAINEGDYVTDTPGGPASLAEADDGTYDWTDVSKATGVSYLRSEVRPRDVTDGLSHTYLVGEKYVPTSAYGAHGDLGHDQTMYSGVDLDLNRWAIDIPLPDGEWVAERRFGSAHPGGCQMLMCDGSVQTVSYNVNPNVHRARGHRRDGGVAE